MPASALFMRCLPSKLNGFVTTPTVRIPSSFAMRAMTGAAPVPVPPPMPQVTKTMSAFFSASVKSSVLSSAAFSPTSGFAPAPRPRVSFSPICMTVEALQNWRACLSVLIPINSTPSMFSSIMRFTALLPAPPTPTTMIFAVLSSSFSLISNKVPASCNCLFTDCLILDNMVYHTYFSRKVQATLRILRILRLQRIGSV